MTPLTTTPAKAGAQLERCVIEWNHAPKLRHSHESGNPDFQPARLWKAWIPAFAGMTDILGVIDHPVLKPSQIKRSPSLRGDDGIKLLKGLKPVFAACFVLAAVLLPAQAQVTDDDIALLNEIMAVDTSPENAKAAHAQCLALQKKLADRQPMDPLQRLYNEAEIEGCIAYALNNGKFTDDKGDACSHHMAFASKLDQVIRDGNGKPGFQGPVMSMISDRLKRATEIGPQLGCTGDYSKFGAAIESAAQAGQQPVAEPDLSLLNDIAAAFGTMKPETAKDAQKTCEALRPKLAEKPNRPAAERLYIEANIINCVVQAMEIGQYSDASGDVCSHTFSYAKTMAEAAAATQGDMLYEGFASSFSEEVKIAAETAKGKGCKEDYSAILPK